MQISKLQFVCFYYPLAVLVLSLVPSPLQHSLHLNWSQLQALPPSWCQDNFQELSQSCFCTLFANTFPIQCSWSLFTYIRKGLTMLFIPYTFFMPVSQFILLYCAPLTFLYKTIHFSLCPSIHPNTLLHKMLIQSQNTDTAILWKWFIFTEPTMTSFHNIWSMKGAVTAKVRNFQWKEEKKNHFVLNHKSLLNVQLILFHSRHVWNLYTT